MSEPNEPTPDTADSAFGTSFEAALAAAYGEEGIKLEPANPKPDIVDPPVDPPVKPVDPPDTIDEVDPPAADDITLPIDEEVPDVEPDEPADTSGMTRAAGERFKEIRAEQKELKTKLATEAQARSAAEARIRELEALNGQSEEVTKKLADYELELSIARLEATDQYKSAVTNPLADIASTADTIATKYGIDANKLLDAIALPDQSAQDEAFDDLLSGVNERDKLKIYAAAEKLPTVIAERARLHENRDGAIAELEARKAAESEATAAETAKSRKAATELVATRVLAKLPFLKGESFNVTAAQEKVAAEDFDSLDTTTKAYNSLSGRLVPQMAKYISTILSELETVTDELGKYKKSSPAPKGGGNAPATPAEANESFVDGLNRAFAGIGA